DGAVRAAAAFVDLPLGDDLDEEDVGFRRADPVELADAVEVRIFRFRALGIDGDLEFVGRLAADLRELTAPVPGNAGVPGRRGAALLLRRPGERRGPGVPRARGLARCRRGLRGPGGRKWGGWRGDRGGRGESQRRRANAKWPAAGLPKHAYCSPRTLLRGGKSSDETLPSNADACYGFCVAGGQGGHEGYPRKARRT